MRLKAFFPSAAGRYEQNLTVNRQRLLQKSSTPLVVSPKNYQMTTFPLKRLAIPEFRKLDVNFRKYFFFGLAFLATESPIGSIARRRSNRQLRGSKH